MFNDQSCVITVQQLLNICHNYGIIVYLNFNTSKSFFLLCLHSEAFKLCFSQLHVHNTSLQYIDSVKYLGFTLTASRKDDEDLLRQIRILFARSNQTVKIFHNCSTKEMVEHGRIFL